ncbi:MAG: hypothetical protein JSU96_13825 [Acidobacteriota bacterium]|nr:MAG: hypothetical protein JSU96_13825 [Acidobacteriota bacterium]
MATVAIVGPDGSGKTTLIKRIVQSDARFRRLYMGVSRESSNFMLPTTWLLRKIQRSKKSPGSSKKPKLKGLDEFRSNKKRSFFGKLARLIHRLSEEWFRQILSWYFQASGRIVIYDRHFLVDFSLKPPSKENRFDVRIHEFVLRHIYPSPDLVLCLDAPSEVLLERKQEFTKERLDWMREGYSNLSQLIPNVKYIDATQSIDAVLQESLQHIRSELKIGVAQAAPENTN